MEVKKITTETKIRFDGSTRPDDFDAFIGQEHIKSVIKTAIGSAQKREDHIGHTLLCGPSGYGKTTMAHIIAKKMGKNIKAVTGYAITKPSEIVSILNNMEKGDILFIDEIHRLRPNVEEVLYIAMEDFVIDMVMPEGGNVRLPIEPFTLIGATTKPESLSKPIKNRFVYNFHFMDYTPTEKKYIISKYLTQNQITFHETIIEEVHHKVDAVPREIHNFCIKIRDFITHHADKNELSVDARDAFLSHSQLEDGGITPLHQKYLSILQEHDRPIGVKTIAIQLGINEKAVEEDIEPLLLKLGKIEKSSKGRVLL